MITAFFSNIKKVYFIAVLKMGSLQVSMFLVIVMSVLLCAITFGG